MPGFLFSLNGDCCVRRCNSETVTSYYVVSVDSCSTRNIKHINILKFK